VRAETGKTGLVGAPTASAVSIRLGSTRSSRHWQTEPSGCAVVPDGLETLNEASPQTGEAATNAR